MMPLMISLQLAHVPVTYISGALQEGQCVTMGTISLYGLCNGLPKPYFHPAQGDDFPTMLGQP